MKLRIWHIINIPREAFRFEVPDTKTAIALLKALADYDLFLGDGEDKPWTSVIARYAKRTELAKGSKVARDMFRAYDRYQLKHCQGGVPLVVSNAQGCEAFEDGEWTEFYDEEGNDVRALSQAS